MGHEENPVAPTLVTTGTEDADLRLDRVEQFTRSGTIPTPVQTALDGRYALQSRQWANVVDYGATGDGTTDDSTAIAAAVTAANGGTVYFPQGTYNVGSTGIAPSSGTRLLGEGRGSIIKNGSASNLVNVNFVGNIVIESLYFDLNNTNNQAIRLAGATDCRVRSCWIAGGSGNGTGIGVLSASASALIEQVRISGCKYGILVNNGSTDTKITDCVLSGGKSTESFSGHLYIPNSVRTTVVNTTVSGAASHGAWIGGSSTVDTTLIGCTFRSNGTAGNDHRGVTVDSTCARTTFIGCVFESNIECGVYVSSTPTLTKFVGCTARANNTDNRAGGHGFEILGQSELSACEAISQGGNAANEGCGFYIGGNGATLTGCTARSNYSDGFRVVDAVKGTVLTGCIAVNNSQAGADTHDGIEIIGTTSASCNNVQVIGCRCYDDQGTKTQRYGISVNAEVDYYVIQGCNTQGNSTGGISDGGDTNKSVTGNI